MQRTAGEKSFGVVNYIILTLFTLSTVLPFINTIAVSFSSERAVVSGQVYFWPIEATLSTYRAVIERSPIVQALLNTILVTVVGVAINMALTILASYSLSKPRLRGRNILLVLITFTMMFNAGIIPNYLVVRALGLVNRYWALWLPGAIATFNMIVLKTFFQSIPQSLEDSAMMDGANDFVILTRIVVPLSLPSIATISLFYAVGHWNSYMNVLIYITSSAKYTLQMRLRQLLFDSNLMQSMTNAVQDSRDTTQVATESLKAASIIVATLPIVIVYPFLQKYFVKGVMIGSIKG